MICCFVFKFLWFTNSVMKICNSCGSVTAGSLVLLSSTELVPSLLSSLCPQLPYSTTFQSFFISCNPWLPSSLCKPKNHK
ncbi:mCG1042837 [Mus musculus]|nr:mCG1042837 [Mus musculus]